MKSIILARVLAAPLFALVALSVHAQANTFDLGAGGGAADYFGSGNNTFKGLFGASATYHFAAHIGVGFEYTYSPVATESQNFAGYAATGSAHLDHYGGVVPVSFKTTEHAEPYVAARFGAVHEVATVSVVGYGSGVSQTQTYTGGYGGAGVGVNVFLTHALGLRPELTYEYLRVNGSHEHEMDAVFTVFYRFGRGRT